MFTEPVMLAIITGLPATIAAIVGLFVSLRAGNKAVESSNKAVAAVAVSEKNQAEIHTLVNSNLTKVKDDLAASIEEIKALRQLVSSISGPGADKLVAHKPTTSEAEPEAKPRAIPLPIPVEVVNQPLAVTNPPETMEPLEAEEVKP